jgi:hypothetical protein
VQDLSVVQVMPEVVRYARLRTLQNHTLAQLCTRCKSKVEFGRDSREVLS